MPYFQPLSQTVNFALQSLRSSITFPTAIFFAAIVVGQVAENPDKETVRAAVSLNADGPLPTYRFDRPNKKATALSRGQDDKVRCHDRCVPQDNRRFVPGATS